MNKYLRRAIIGLLAGLISSLALAATLEPAWVGVASQSTGFDWREI